MTYWRDDNHALTVLESTEVVNWGYAQHALVRHWRRTGDMAERRDSVTVAGDEESAIHERLAGDVLATLQRRVEVTLVPVCLVVWMMLR